MHATRAAIRARTGSEPLPGPRLCVLIRGGQTWELGHCSHSGVPTPSLMRWPTSRVMCPVAVGVLLLDCVRARVCVCQ